MTSTGTSIGQFEISRDGRDHGRPRDLARTHRHTTFGRSGASRATDIVEVHRPLTGTFRRDLVGYWRAGSRQPLHSSVTRPALRHFRQFDLAQGIVIRPWYPPRAGRRGECHGGVLMPDVFAGFENQHN